MSNSEHNEKFTKIKSQSNWNLPNVAFMVGGFVVAFPVGVATAAWLALGKDVNIARTLKGTYDEYSPAAKSKYDDLKNSFGNKFGNNNNPDNAAYQAYKAEKAAEYEAAAHVAAEEAKTEEQQFNEYMAWQKQAKDEASFADFQAHQKTQTDTKDSQ